MRIYNIKEIQKVLCRILNNANRVVFNKWGESENSILFDFLHDEVYKKGYNCFSMDSDSYIVTFKPGSRSKGGMDMGLPDCMVLEKLNEFKKGKL